MRPKAPWIVGRATLLEYGVDDFLNEMTRQKPWCRARYEAVLTELLERLEALFGRPALVSDMGVASTLAGAEAAREALTELAAYLMAWGWLEPARASL